MKDSNISHLRGWTIVARDAATGERPYWESLCTLGNGLLGVRGAAEEISAAGESRPMTLMAEVYDRPGRLEGEPRKFRRPSRLVCLPNALSLHVHDGKEIVTAAAPVEETLTLDMRRGVLTRDARFKGTSGRVTRIVSHRIVSQARPNVIALSYEITPENYSGPVTVLSAIDGSAGYEDGIVQTREISSGVDGATAWYAVRTVPAKIAVAVASRIAVRADGPGAAQIEPSPVSGDRQAGVSLKLNAHQGVALHLEKAVSIHNNLHAGEPLEAALEEVADLPGFPTLEREHAAEWADYWKVADIRIDGDRLVQTMARFFVFHLLQSASRNNVRQNLSASIPAKSMSGPGYNGHIFWDTEIYMLPFFSQQFPDIAESLLRYRSDRLAAGEADARQCGLKGVRFPWESADTGREECPKWLKRPDGTYFRWRGGEEEIHITADVAMGCHQHYLATGDDGFLFGPALEIAVATARYWESVVKETQTPAGPQFHIRGVIGPDEYHSGVNDSVYTNAMAAWNLRWAASLLDRAGSEQPALSRSFRREHKLSASEVKRWLFVADRLKIGFDPKTGLYEQFEGYFQHPRQQIKQADVMLLLYLLPQLSSPEIFRANFRRYYPVTLHGSSLSPALHVMFSLEAGRPEKAYAYMRQACGIDGIRQGGSSDDGIHSAALGGGWSAIVAGFGGVKVGPDRIVVDPQLPAHWRRLEFSLQVHGLRLRFLIRPDRLTITAGDTGKPAILSVRGKTVRIRRGETLDVRGRWTLPAVKPPRCRGSIQAVLFDLDGVVVSTDEFHYLAWKQLADEEGIYFDHDINHRLRGVSRMASLDILLERAAKTYSAAEKEAMATRKNETYRKLLEKLTPRDILPGVMVLLEELKDLGVKAAIASSSRNTPMILRRIGLTNRFDAVADGNDISRTKPDPEVFLTAARRLKIPPARCLVVEDAGAGVEGAVAAGMRCVAVGAAAGHPAANLSMPDLSAASAQQLLSAR
jgi:kojibiose phosphorylase